MRYSNYKDLPGPNRAAELMRRAKEIYGASYVLSQIKYNGMHVKVTGGEAYSKAENKWNEWCRPKILDTLVDLTKAYPALTTHLELFSSTISFADYMGLTNVERIVYDPRVDSEGHIRIFDCMRADQPWEPFEQRLDWIKSFGYPVADYAKVHYADTLDYAYDTAISGGHEGCIYRIPPCLYLQGTRPTYTSIYKRKKLQEIEGICVAIKAGNGKRKGMVGSLVVQLPNGRAISVGGGEGWTDTYMTKLYRNPPINCLVTITFEDCTDEGMPLRPQAKAVRNYE